MNSQVRGECVYLSDSWGIHDKRWCAALETLGFSVTRALTDHTDPTIPIIAGPLTTISPTLCDLPNPVIGLSWGFDLHELKASGHTAWLTRLTGIIVDSQPTWDIARKAGVPAGHIVMIPWGIDLAEFVPDRKASLHVRLQILTLRAHEPLYSVETVINAAKILQDRDCDVELVIGNTGSLTKDLTALASDLGLSHVNFVGKITESDLPKYFNNADVYVSAAQTDGTSVTLLQAMSMKVPVVVSDSPGNIALLTTTDETGNLLRRGALFHTDNAESLATTLENFGSDPLLIERQVIAAWEYVQTHADWNRNIQRLLPLLHSR